MSNDALNEEYISQIDAETLAAFRDAWQHAGITAENAARALKELGPLMAEAREEAQRRQALTSPDKS